MKRLLIALAVALAGSPALAADKSVLDAARKEGRVAFYANITAVEPIMKAFTADTGIKAEYTRISSPKFVATTITEFEANRLLGCFIGENCDDVVPLIKCFRMASS